MNDMRRVNPRCGRVNVANRGVFSSAAPRCAWPARDIGLLAGTVEPRATTIINVSNRLPVTIGADDRNGDAIRKSSGGLVAGLEGLPRDEYDLLWLGWPGAEVREPERQRALRQRLHDEFRCVPVFLSREEADGHYEGFANSSV